MTKELINIVEKSYQVFKKYKATQPLDVCTECCMTKNQESELVSMSVRNIPFDLLYDYNTAAKTENPDINEFKHFLPRFLELTAELKFLHHDEEIVLYRFDNYDKSEWSKEEKTLLQNFANSFFQYCLSKYPLPDLATIDGILVMLWKMKVDIEQLLEDWLKVNSINSIYHFNHLINYAFKDNQPKELSSPWTDEILNKLIAQWIDMEETKNKFANDIEKIIMKPPSNNIEERTLAELSWTYEKMKIKTHHNNGD